MVEFCKTHPETAGYTFPNPTSWYNVLVKATNRSKVPSNIKAIFKSMSKEFYVEDKENCLIDLDTQLVYGDRIRIREPGKAAALPLHLTLRQSKDGKTSCILKCTKSILKVIGRIGMHSN